MVPTTNISLTDQAAEHIRQFLGERDTGLRLAVKPTGCSGYQYVVTAADKASDQDQVFKCHDIKILIDPLSLQLMNGTRIDYVRQGLNEGFQFNNPNTQAVCGCGESFSVAKATK